MKADEKHDRQLPKEIVSGKYRHCYLIYNRKSTDDTDNQKNSIKYQKSENVRFAFRENLRIAPLILNGFCTDGIVSERHSGFKENIELRFGSGNTVQYRVDRPKFHRLVQHLSKGHFKGVIFLCWDRASRNKGDDTILRKLMKAGVDIRFTLAQYDNTSAGALHMDIDGMFAEHHSRVTSEKVKIAKRNLRERGVCTYKAPVGYLNPGNMYQKPIDPERAPIIKQLFEKAATDNWSLADLARWTIEQGFTMPPFRRRRTEEEILAEEEDDVRLEIEPLSRIPTFTTIHKILTNPFYTGQIIGNDGVWIKSASHEPLVSIELFNRVQDRLGSHRTSARYVQLIDHPLRRLVYCADCGRVYTPYVQKGSVYYGARCHEKCSNTLKSFNFDYIAKKIGGLIQRLSFTDEELAEIDARASTDVAVLDVRRTKRLEEGERRKATIREDLAYLNANRLMLLRTSAYTAESLVAEEARLNLELNALNEAEALSDISMAEVIKEVVKLSELLKNASVIYDSSVPEEKNKIARVVFSELRVSQNTFNYVSRNGFRSLSSRFLPSHDPIAWISELTKQHECVLASINEIREVVPNQ